MSTLRREDSRNILSNSQKSKTKRPSVFVNCPLRKNGSAVLKDHFLHPRERSVTPSARESTKFFFAAGFFLGDAVVRVAAFLTGDFFFCVAVGMVLSSSSSPSLSSSLSLSPASYSSSSLSVLLSSSLLSLSESSARYLALRQIYHEVSGTASGKSNDEQKKQLFF